MKEGVQSTCKNPGLQHKFLVSKMVLRVDTSRGPANETLVRRGASARAADYSLIELGMCFIELFFARPRGRKISKLKKIHPIK